MLTRKKSKRERYSNFAQKDRRYSALGASRD